MKSFLLKLFTIAQAKYVFLASWFSAFFLPIKGFLILSTVLVASDTISGMWAAKKRGERFQSSKFYRLVQKTTVYFMSIICAHGIQLAFMVGTGIEWMPVFPMVHLVAGSICFTEFLSFRENVESLTGVDVLGGFKKNIQKFLDAIPKP
jgi:hypothetical protein